MKEIYGIDMSENQHPKLISDVPDFDIGVTMGCDVVCPTISATHIEDWNLDDPLVSLMQNLWKLLRK